MQKTGLFAFWRALRPDGQGRRTREACPICPLHPGISRHFRHLPGVWESGNEDVLPVVVEVGEMTGGGGVAEVEILVEVQALLYLPARPGMVVRMGKKAPRLARCQAGWI